ncbi:dipeptidase [Micrococcoides hystricis]|uniref:Dipeptidase n=1 Tax=Micrococcoides hystricis TaxID=1572761 RepID=A0ABV6P7C1_9MICC
MTLSHPAANLPLDPAVIAELKTSVANAFPATVATLSEHVKIPAMAWDAYDPALLEESAKFVAEQCKQAGFTDVQILTAERSDRAGQQGAPAVVAHRPGPAGAPRVLLYAHHDVQPIGDEALWNTEPLVASEVDGRLYGRGTADDKAGIMVHLAALEALADVTPQTLDQLSITVFIEGEEEAGSPSFANFLKDNHEVLDADVIVVADSSNWKVGQPALTSSLRGMLDATIEVKVMEHAVHSGMFGGPVLDAPTLLARIIASLHTADGSVAVPGLLSHDVAEIDYAEADYRRDAGIIDSLQLAGTGSIADRLWNKPAINLIGFDAPAVAVASNTLLPTARAKVSMRLAPGQDPAQAMAALKAHVLAQDVMGAEVLFIEGEQGHPFSADTNSEIAQLQMAAFTAAWETEAVTIGMGGSIPFVADLKDQFPDAEIMITGIEDPDTRAHAANESLHLTDFQHAIEAEALFLASLAERNKK